MPVCEPTSDGVRPFSVAVSGLSESHSVNHDDDPVSSSSASSEQKEQAEHLHQSQCEERCLSWHQSWQLSLNTGEASDPPFKHTERIVYDSETYYILGIMELGRKEGHKVLSEKRSSPR